MRKTKGSERGAPVKAGAFFIALADLLEGLLCLLHRCLC